MNQRRQIEPEQVLRAEQPNAERAVFEECLTEEIGVRKARQQQRIGPDENADAHAGEGPARRAVAPDEPANERRCKLRDRRERDRKSTRLNSSHVALSRMPSSA